MDNNSQLKITSLQELQDYARGSVVELPPFAEGQPFVARLRRPSMLAMVKSGRIPNELLHEANTLFMGRSNNKEEKLDEGTMSRMFEIFDRICEASFVEPTYKEILDSGIELTDDQYTFVFNYTQLGVKALSSFRE